MEYDNLDPEDVNSAPADDSEAVAPDANDEIPVPIAMSAAEIDERAQAVELRRELTTPIADEELQP